MNNDDIRVSISEAARLFGVSVKTIRQAIKNQEIVYIIVNGRYKINFKSLVLWSQLSTRRRNLLAQQGIGQYVDNWRIQNTKYSPRLPQENDSIKNKNDFEPPNSEPLTYVETENKLEPKI